ncbi:hypothetical protein [Streptomyces sp. NPDC051776]
MKNGIFIPAVMVRAAVGLLAAAVITALVAEAPGIRRYIKLETM